MLVLNLCCAQDHGFEGWFASASEFESQQARGLVSCPVCGISEVRRLPSAPRLNVSHLRREAAPAERGSSHASEASAPLAAAQDPAQPADGEAMVRLSQLQGQLMQALRSMAAQTENVGVRFAEEARRIHYGEAAPRSIRGQASRADTEALIEEGIEVLPLPDLPGLDEPLQ